MHFRLIDFVTAALIYFAVVFGPWAFGTTQFWSVHIMNGVGAALGILWLIKLALLGFSKNKPAGCPPTPGLTTKTLALTTVMVLLYCLISAVNARATYHPKNWEFEYHPIVTWLPHSYDSDSSWFVFWQYLSLAGLFWALRHWLLTMTPDEARERAEYKRISDSLNPDEPAPDLPGKHRLPAHLRRLLWVMATSGALLGIQGIIQRAQGGDKVLWLLKPVENAQNVLQFGPFPYRGNASQYFNLLWPVVFGLFWMEFNFGSSPVSKAQSLKSKKIFWLIPAMIFIAVCPLVAASRAGAAVMLFNLGLVVAVLWFKDRNKVWQNKLIIPCVMAAILIVGGLLGWATLAPRLRGLSTDAQDRQAMSQVGREIAADNPVFGTGPGSLQTVYQLYRHRWTDYWPTQLHNDWLEALVTFGWVGFSLIFICLILAVSNWFFGRGIRGEKSFTMLVWIALLGCLLHAWVDWPFECHAVLTLFLVLCSISSCLAGKKIPGG